MLFNCTSVNSHTISTQPKFFHFFLYACPHPHTLSPPGFKELCCGVQHRGQRPAPGPRAPSTCPTSRALGCAGAGRRRHAVATRPELHVFKLKLTLKFVITQENSNFNETKKVDKKHLRFKIRI